MYMFKKTGILFNVHLKCFVVFITCPTDKYVFKVINKKKIHLHVITVKDIYSMILFL